MLQMILFITKSANEVKEVKKAVTQDSKLGDYHLRYTVKRQKY